MQQIKAEYLAKRDPNQFSKRDIWYSKLEQKLPDPKEREAYIANILKDPAKRAEFESLTRLWKNIARPAQLAPKGHWQRWFLRAGRRFGKTRACAEWLVNEALTKPGDYAVVGRTARDLKENNFMHKTSGFLAICKRVMGDEFSRTNPKYDSRQHILRFKNGSTIYGFVGETPDGVRGAGLSAIWYDELAAYTYAREVWDASQYSVSEGDGKILISTTPNRKNQKLLKEIIALPDTVLTTGSSWDNISVLGANYGNILSSKEGTRNAREEIYAEFLEDRGSLFNYSWIADNRQEVNPRDLSRVVVSVDPANSNSEDSDESGIIVAGKKRRKGGEEWEQGYVLADYSFKGSVYEVAKRAIGAYYEFNASAIVIETNNGGRWIPTVILQIDPNVRIKEVKASEGKAVRAEPVSGFYEQNRIHHVKEFVKLETQMIEFNPDVPLKRHDESPDRMDALVWAFTDLFPRTQHFDAHTLDFTLGIL